MASAVSQGLPSLSPSLSSEENRTYANELDTKLTQVCELLVSKETSFQE